MPFTAPQDIHAAFASALEASDLDSLVDLYEPDAVNALPDGRLIVGAEARRAMFEGVIEAGAEMTGTQRLAVVADDIALTSTAYVVAGAQPDDEPTTVVTAEISRRQPDGSWRVIIDAPGFA